MRLLKATQDPPVLETFSNPYRIPDYAILSHTWLEDDQEILFEHAQLGVKRSDRQINQYYRMGFSAFENVDSLCSLDIPYAQRTVTLVDPSGQRTQTGLIGHGHDT